MTNDAAERALEKGKQNADWYQAIAINREIHEKSVREGSRGNLAFVLFIAAIILFKPVAEYGIELYAYLAACAHDAITFLGL